MKKIDFRKIVADAKLMTDKELENLTPEQEEVIRDAVARMIIANAG